MRREGLPFWVSTKALAFCERKALYSARQPKNLEKGLEGSEACNARAGKKDPRNNARRHKEGVV